MNLLQVEVVAEDSNHIAHINIDAITFIEPGPNPAQSKIHLHDSKDIIIDARLADVATELRHLFTEAKGHRLE